MIEWFNLAQDSILLPTLLIKEIKEMLLCWTKTWLPQSLKYKWFTNFLSLHISQQKLPTRFFCISYFNKTASIACRARRRISKAPQMNFATTFKQNSALLPAHPQLSFKATKRKKTNRAYDSAYRFLFAAFTI